MLDAVTQLASTVSQARLEQGHLTQRLEALESKRRERPPYRRREDTRQGTDATPSSPRGACFNCNEMGHYAVSCPRRRAASSEN